MAVQLYLFFFSGVFLLLDIKYKYTQFANMNIPPVYSSLLVPTSITGEGSDSGILVSAILHAASLFPFPTDLLSVIFLPV